MGLYASDLRIPTSVPKTITWAGLRTDDGLGDDLTVL